jgi:O-antigen/teichoic acid export membrane protein
LIINIVISFFLAPYIVHKLGNYYYGVWAIVMQFTGYLYLIDFGVRDSVIKYTSRFNAKKLEGKINETVTSALLLYTVIALFGLLLVTIFAFTFQHVFEINIESVNEVRAVVFLSGLTIALSFMFNVFSGVLIGLQKFYICNVYIIIISFIRLFFIVYLLDAGYGIIALSGIQLGNGLMTGLMVLAVTYFTLKKSGYLLKLKIRSKARFYLTVRKLLNYSFVVFINNIAAKIIFATDAIVIGIFLNATSVTFYAIAGNLVEYLKQLMVTSSSIFNPLTSHMDALGDREKIQDIIDQGIRFGFFVGLPILTTYILLGSEFIGLWMGEEYIEQSGIVLIVLSITQLLSLQQYSISGVLYGMSQHKTMAKWRVFEALCNIALSIYLVEKIGILGVAIGTAIPHTLVSLIVFPVLAKNVCGVSIARIYGSILKSFLAVLPFVALTLFFKFNIDIESLFEFFVLVFANLILYIVAAYLFLLTKSEKSVVSRQFAKLPLLNKL